MDELVARVSKRFGMSEGPHPSTVSTGIERLFSTRLKRCGQALAMTEMAIGRHCSRKTGGRGL
jgi:hypothetical protein